MFEDAIPTLEEFVSTIGLDLKRLPDWEGFHRVSFEVYSLPASQTGKLELRHFRRLENSFGGCFSCKFVLHSQDLREPGENPVILAFPPFVTQADLDRFRQRIKEEEVDSLEFSFQLDKGKMLAKEGLSAPDRNFYLYLFPIALTRFLRGETLAGEPCSAYDSLKMFEENLWHVDQPGSGLPPDEVDRKAVILVLDHDIQLKGDFFSLLGGKYIDKWQEDIAAGGLPKLGSKSIYEICRTNVFWDNRWVTRLTPPKLKINDETSDKDDLMGAALRTQLFNLVVLFTASRIAGSGGDWTATYSSSRGTGDVMLYSPAQLQLEHGVLENVDALYEIFAWAYFSKWPRDRIAFVQGTLAEELIHSPREDAGKVLLERAEMLKAILNNRWDNFVTEKLQAYSKEENELEEAVAETVDSFAGQVTTMGKSVSDAMLAAIAALLGSFVAAGFGTDSFNPFIFRVGMLVYSTYVLFFPFLYNMRAQWIQYKMLREGIVGRIKRLEIKLSKDRMKVIAGTQLEKSDSNFRFWFWITVGIYILVILLGFAAAFAVPGLIGGSP